MPKWWPLPENNAKKIYITMGTTGEGHLFSKIYHQFKQTDFICIVTTGSQADHFKTIPDKIYVENYMDGEKILENSDLVVCHGGNGTIYQALSMGKPVIGIPTIPDQDFNMRRVETLGAGIRIPMKEALQNPEIIVQAANYILENKSLFEKNLLTLRKRIEEFSGAKLAAEIIKNYLKKSC
jgi:UDP:flavonoid glycosyltransferase YjiC (YdhE family)